MDYIVSKLVRNEDENGKQINVFYYEIAGTSSDTKPTENVATGSIFTEVDTGSVFFFDADGEEWVEQFSFQG